MSDRHEDGASGQEPVRSLMDSDAESGGGKREGQVSHRGGGQSEIKMSAFHKIYGKIKHHRKEIKKKKKHINKQHLTAALLIM